MEGFVSASCLHLSGGETGGGAFRNAFRLVSEEGVSKHVSFLFLKRRKFGSRMHSIRFSGVSWY